MDFLADQIVIVTGLPRSGTSMMMQMLDAGGLPALTDHVRQPDDNNPKGYFEFEPVKKIKTDASWLDSAKGKVVKMVHLLLYDLPPSHGYRVILMRRPIEQVLASQATMLTRDGKKGAALPADRLAKTFEQQLEKIQQWLTSQPNIEYLTVQHNVAVKDPSSQAKQINDFLGGALDTSAMAAVVDPTLYRQRHGENG